MSEVVYAYPAIRCSGVSRVFRLPGRRTRVAVDHLTLEVPAGGVFGFLGANGAGKTTTIKMLMGLLRPTHGRLEIFGESCAEHTTRRHVGYLPEQPYFHSFLSPLETLKVHAELLGMSRSETCQQVDMCLELCGLERNRDLPLSRLSKGNQQRVGIAQALLGPPRLLILDEPTSGLDPVARHEVRQIIARVRAEGRTVFLSSHVLSEIETLCDHVAVLNEGRLCACGTPDEVEQGGDHMRVVVGCLTPAAAEQIRALDVEVEEDAQVTLGVASADVFRLLRIVEANDLPLVSVSPARENLEDAFLRLAA